LRYIIKAVGLCPEGNITSTKYWIAKNEIEMKAMLEMPMQLTDRTCIGPETELGYTLKNHLKQTQQSIEAEQC